MSDPQRGEATKVTLRRGSQIPIIGFGTWQIAEHAAREAAATALELGYRHVDTATVYANERGVGQALAQSGLARGELFVTTKLPGNALDVRGTIEQSLDELGLDYVDLWLIHWPPARSHDRAGGSSRRLFEEMLAVRDEGLARAVGVSNYSTEEIDELIAATGESPELNQIPWSPFRHAASVRQELEARGVRLEGYSPINTSRLGDPVLVEIAESCGVTPAQVVLRWHLQHGVVVLPKSVHRARIAENLDLFGFSLSPDAMRRLDELSPR